MDWNLAIERNREALKRILAMLVAMAELGGQFTFFPQKSALPQGSVLAEKSKLSPASTLPRHLHTAVLRLLRPAEAAVRRLIIVAARSVVVPPPPPRSAWSPSPASQGRISGAAGTTWILPLLSLSKERRRGTAEGGGGGAGTISSVEVAGIAKPHLATRPLALPLFDALPRWNIRPRRPVPTSVPRISVPGYTTLSPIVPRRLPAPDDPVDATRLGLRFAALAAALDDLPRQAKRFARWRARRDAIIAQDRNPDAAEQTGEPRRSKPHRIWPLRPGRPPGQHPRQGRKKSRHDVHEILKDLHGLAFDVLEERRDTS
ncbi:hypothetical protein [Mesorhizobium sp. ZC-5]|uniref:hypothetical protein n=1 Tax=Mesorhizobium sp. ZC-5 TaxID=2986066 RepID=UPI0021E8582E|nr:hypothetical protein [Mesorhizobium sp. ZC-5]MCV3242774.1 hypothetical protein [Mesorhizobium sp. ZC-5]